MGRDARIGRDLYYPPRVLGKLFDLRPGEGRLALPAMALALLVFAAQVLATIVSDAVFVTTFDLGGLSGFIVVAAVVRVVATFAYGALARGWGRHSGAAALAAAGIAVAGLGAALDRGGAFLVYAACVALLVVPVAASDAASAAMEAFPARQGKRLVPLVAASSSVGAMLAGVAARALTPRIGTPRVLWVAAGCLLAAAVTTRWVARAEIETGAARSRGRARGPGAAAADVVDDLRRRPIVRTAFALALLVALTHTVADYLFKGTLKRAFDRDAMAEYTGVMEAALSAGTIVAQLFVTARVAGKLGVRASLLIYPTAVAATAPVFAVSPRVATATLTKLTETSLRFSIVTPVRTLLVAPLEPRERARAGALVRGLATPLGSVMAGGVLAAFGAQGASAPVLAGMLVGAAALAMLVLAGARRAYAAALAGALGEGRLTLDVPPTQAAALRAGVEGMLRQAEAAGDARRAAKLRGLLAERDAADDEAPPSRAGDGDGEIVAMATIDAALAELANGTSRGLVRAGALRAVRRLVRLGPAACERLLARWGDLTHGAREAAARALCAAPDAVRGGLLSPAVEGAVEITLRDAEALAGAGAPGDAAGALFAREVRLRIDASAVCAVDLASVLGERARIAKARSALARTQRSRADALELLEEVLPRRFARRTLALLELDGAHPSAPPDSPRAPLDPWLDACRRYDAGELSSDAVASLLDKVVVLGESSLFDGMTSEELYPVGEIAEVVDLAAGETAVRQGDPGDALYVVEGGTLEVKQDGRKLKEVGRGAVFGEMALLDGSPRSASVVALTAARLLRIPRAEFDALLDEYPAIARGIIRTLILHLRSQR